MNPRATQHIVGADTIRALATLWVFIGHLFVMEPALKTRPLPGSGVWISGYMGVAAFFVLSGFLLSTPFWRAHRAGTGMPSLKTYALRRLARIVPEYYACVLLIALIVGALADRWGWIQVAGCLTFTNTLLPATYMPAWNPPLWSIGIEMTFYLMLPVVALGVLRCRGAAGGRAVVVVLLGLIALAQPLLLWAAPSVEAAVGNVSLFSAGSSATTKNAVVLFAHFLIGVLAADIHLAGFPRYVASRFNRYDTAVIAAVVLIVGSLALAVPLPGLGYMHYQWPTFPALIGVLLVCLPRSGLIGQAVEGRFVRATATLSYGIYIWHVPVLTALKQLWPANSEGRIAYVLPYALTALACSYLTAWVSYRFVGRPALDRLHQSERKHPADPALTAAPLRRAA